MHSSAPSGSVFFDVGVGMLCFALLGGFTRRGKVHVKQSMSTIHNYPPRHFMVRRITPQQAHGVQLTQQPPAQKGRDLA